MRELYRLKTLIEFAEYLNSEWDFVDNTSIGNVYKHAKNSSDKAFCFSTEEIFHSFFSPQRLNAIATNE